MSNIKSPVNSLGEEAAELAAGALSAVSEGAAIPRKRALPPMNAGMIEAMNVFFSTGGNGAETARITGKPKATINDWADKYGWRVKLGLSQAPLLAEVQAERREAHQYRVTIGRNILKAVDKDIQEHPEIGNLKYYLTKAKDLETVGDFVEDSNRVLVETERKVAIDPEKEEEEPDPEPEKNPIDIN